MIFLPSHYGHLIRILHSQTDQTITNALAAMELTSSQGHIMGYLAHCVQAPCSRDIEEAFHLSHPTVSGLLSRLEKKGFIEFRPDKTDRRCKRICSLPKGAACNETMRKTIDDSEARIVAGFSPEEKTQFILFLNRAIRNLETCPGKHQQKEEKAND